MPHTGRVHARPTSWGGVLVLCPAGHVVTASLPGEWAGSDLEARVAFGWVVTCHGAISAPSPDATTPTPEGECP